MKSTRFGSGQGANPRETPWHRAELQRRHGPKGAISCAVKREADHYSFNSSRSCQLVKLGPALRTVVRSERLPTTVSLTVVLV